MPTVYKVLGQVQPAANTLTTAYTVPASTNTVMSLITICNMGPSVTTYRVAVRIAGASLTEKQYIYYDSSIAPQDTLNVTQPFTLGDGDVVSVESFSGLVAFNLFGSEIS